MKIQSRTDYGLRALVLLAEQPGELLSKTQIAELEGIPESYLEQILSLLRRAGFIESVRGAGGGFRLARPAAAITLADVIRTLEGSLSPIGCVHDAHDGLDFCSRAADCRTRLVWIKLTDCITSALEGLTLAEVAVPQKDTGSL